MHHHHHHHSHAHTNTHAHASKGSSLRNIKIAFLTNFTFSVVEVVGGYLTGSVAIMTDAVHDLGDSVSLGLAYVFERAANRGADVRFSYGYRRLSLLSAFITASVLIIGSSLVLTEAIPRLLSPSQPHTGGMLGLAVLGVVVNGFAAWRVSSGATLNEKVISWHLLEDVLGWVAVLLGALIMTFFDVPILDPILSIVFSLFIARGVFRTLRQALRLFMQAVPESLDFARLKTDMRAVEGIQDIHDLHIWSLDGDAHVLTMHAIIAETVNAAHAKKIKQELRERLKAYGNFHVTIELEVDPEHCSEPHCVTP